LVTSGAELEPCHATTDPGNDARVAASLERILKCPTAVARSVARPSTARSSSSSATGWRSIDRRRPTLAITT